MNTRETKLITPKSGRRLLAVTCAAALLAQASACATRPVRGATDTPQTSQIEATTQPSTVNPQTSSASVEEPPTRTTSHDATSESPGYSTASEPKPINKEPGFRETFPGLHVDVANKIIELDAEVPINAQAERVYLEVLVCTPNSREHETLVVTNVKPSQVHAMLLLIGAQPGTPPRWDFDGTNLKPVAPTGPVLDVFLREASQPASANLPIADFVSSVTSDRTLATYVRKDTQRPDKFVFAGSRLVENGYAADMDGTIIGLTAFGSETIAWSAMYHPDTDRMSPDWIADGKKLPKIGTKMIVTIKPR